jgi:hypothetical protein
MGCGPPGDLDQRLLHSWLHDAIGRCDLNIGGGEYLLSLADDFASNCGGAFRREYFGDGQRHHMPGPRFVLIGLSLLWAP